MKSRIGLLLIAGTFVLSCSAKPAGELVPHQLADYRISAKEAERRIEHVRQTDVQPKDGALETHWQAWREGIDYGRAIADAKSGDIDGFVIVLWTGQFTDAAGAWFHGADCIELAVLFGEASTLKAVDQLPAFARARALDDIFLGALDFLKHAVDAAHKANASHELPKGLEDLPRYFPAAWKRWVEHPDSSAQHYLEYFDRA